MPTDHEAVGRMIAGIEAEMKRIGMWQAEPIEPERLEIRQAFGGDQLSFEQWLQFVFIARVRGIVDSNGTFPSSSQVADQAFREWKMFGEREDVDPLLDLLRDFDATFQ